MKPTFDNPAPPDEPPSLVWVARFITSMNRALDGDIHSYELQSRTDPLQWVLVITLNRNWLRVEMSPLRGQLRMWAETNNAEYQRSTWSKREFRALLLLRSLRPERNISPYEEADDIAVHRRRRGRLRGPSRADRGRRSDDARISPKREDS